MLLKKRVKVVITLNFNPAKESISITISNFSSVYQFADYCQGLENLP